MTPNFPMPQTDANPSATGTAATPAALCVSMHDVSPHTWPQCDRLLQAVRQVADIPVTLLVVPAYHRRPDADFQPYRRALDQRLAAGDELALHGYTHLDEGPPSATWRSRFIRQAYTQSEGEFSALDEAEARRRIEIGLGWFQQHGWPVHGFVAPAFLMSEGAWQALAGSPFRYTTTMRRFHLLASRRDIPARTMVYAARNATGRWLSRLGNDFLVTAQRSVPLIRLGLHPRDADHPNLIRHLQTTLEAVLPDRHPMTKNVFADLYERRLQVSERIVIAA